MAETIQNTVDRLTAFISQNYSDIEVGPGSVISELLIKLAASIQNEQYNTIATLKQSAYISDALNATTDTYSPIMDAVASNFNVSRSTGSYVTGKIKVTVSALNEYNLREGFVFVQPGLNLNYTLIADTRVVEEKSLTTLNEVQLYSANGLYYFILDVVAENVGPQYQVPSGTVFSLAPKGYLNKFVKAEAYGNFSSGKRVDTDKELIAKIKTSLGNSRLTSSAGIAKNFAEKFPSFQYLSVCGANDLEMVRSKQNILGISTFGKADVYVRSSIGLELTHITKTATKIAENTWRLELQNKDVPGFYRIQSIVPTSTLVNLGGTLLPTSVVYGFSIYPGERNNEIAADTLSKSASNARFTKYQTATVVFNYDDPENIAVGQTASFELHISNQPHIAEMQDMLLSDEHRLACADYLVRAVVPCMVSLNINLVKKRVTDTYESLNIQQLKKDLFEYVNTIPFGEELYASSLIDICHNYDIRRVDLPISMEGTIICPDGSTIILQDSDVLTIPTNLSKGVTPKTTAYFIDYYRIEDGVTQPIDNIGLNIA
jgi:hypothetical protein